MIRKRLFSYFLATTLGLASAAQAGSEALVIIDMQTTYCEDMDDLVGKIVEKINQAMQTDSHIIFVTMEGSIIDPGPIHPQLEAAVAGYAKIKLVPKYDSDGSYEVAQTLAGLTDIDRVEVCGVYTGACVQATVLGLIARTNIPVSVLASLCQDADGRFHRQGIRRMLRKGARIIR